MQAFQRTFSNSIKIFNNLTSMEFLLSLRWFLERVVNTTSGPSVHRGGNHTGSCGNEGGATLQRLKVSFPWELSRSWFIMKFNFDKWIKLRKNNLKCSDWRQREIWITVIEKQFQRGNDWQARIELRVLHSPLQKSK